MSSFPELGHLGEVERAALMKRSGVRRAMTVVCVRSAAVGVLLFILVAAVLSNAGIGWAPWAAAGAALGVSVVSYQLFVLRIRAQLRAALLDGLAGERVPVCLRCGYDVRDTVEDRCPECGARIRVPR